MNPTTAGHPNQHRFTRHPIGAMVVLLTGALMATALVGPTATEARTMPEPATKDCGLIVGPHFEFTWGKKKREYFSDNHYRVDAEDTGCALAVTWAQLILKKHITGKTGQKIPSPRFFRCVLIRLGPKAYGGACLGQEGVDIHGKDVSPNITWMPDGAPPEAYAGG